MSGEKLAKRGEVLEKKWNKALKRKKKKFNQTLKNNFTTVIKKL